MWHAGFVHAGQFQQRTAGVWVATLLAYLNLFESFILIAPYFFSVPVFAFFLVGVFHVESRRPSTRAFLWLWGVWSLIILVVQSTFGSFQYRYMLPLLPGCLALAGVGCAWTEVRFAQCRRRAWFSAILVLSLAYMTLFTSAVLVFQRQAFGDQRAAADFVREKTPPRTPVFSNEHYGGYFHLGSVKQSFWSGREVRFIADYLPPTPQAPPTRWLPDNSVVIISNAYGGDEMVDRLLSQMAFFYHIRLIAAFSSTVYPLHDDVMVSPMFNQNPLGWVFRYSAQLFSTHVYVVDQRRSEDEIQQILRRQLIPPGAKPVPGKDGRLTVTLDGFTSPSTPDGAQ
jgi:hypothetical protein